MSEQQSGLRFDIYERVHLPEEGSAILELDEVELTPQIQVAVEGNQAIVRGCLLLTGSYTGQAEGNVRASQTLEHPIPVEITLPMNRIRSVEAISVEIDNFDIDLLSSRSLNVTGVLSLNGIEMVTAAPDQWREEEEIVFVHEHLQADDTEEETSDPADPVEAQAAEPSDAFGQDARDSHEAEPVLEAIRESDLQQAAAGSSEKRDEELNADDLVDYEVLEQYDQYAAVPPPPGPEEWEQHPVDASEAVETVGAIPEAPDKGEMKIAFGSKKNEVAGFDFKSVLGKSDDTRNADSAKAAASPKAGSTSKGSQTRGAEHAEEKTDASGGDALEWKSLFISSDEERQFRKVRLCIVHKNDTLESIARKYERKPHEIRLYNQLNDQELSEGQVIYIP